MELPLGIDQTGEWDLIRAIFSVAGPVGSHNIKVSLGDNPVSESAKESTFPVT